MECEVRVLQVLLLDAEMQAHICARQLRPQDLEVLSKGLIPGLPMGRGWHRRGVGPSRGGADRYRRSAEWVGAGGGGGGGGGGWGGGTGQ